MTRTPSDMETVMSEATKRPWTVEPPLIDRFELAEVSPSYWVMSPWSNGVRRVVADCDKKEDAELIVACVNALSALGDPVVVAEALPELVEAADELIHGRVPAGKMDFDRAAQERRQRLNAALAKLKARP